MRLEAYAKRKESAYATRGLGAFHQAKGLTLRQGVVTIYWISEFAAMTGLSTSAVRFYERQGLLKSQRSDCGYRYFSMQDAFRVNAFRTLLFYGLSVEQAVEELDREQDNEQFKSLLEDQYEKLSTQADALNRRVVKVKQAIELIRSDEIESFKFVDVEDYLFARASHGSDFNISTVNKDEIRILYEMFGVSACARILKKTEFEQMLPTIHPDYIITIPERELQRIPKRDSLHFEKMVMGKCIHYIRRVDREKSEQMSSFKGLIDYLEDHGYKLRADIILFPTYFNLDGNGCDVETLYVPVV
ncbi:MAG: MerR family transcriptional regulator [Coriobacteriaceae bacterium]|nr:MerR family transcriptional regulator [Coriobacteriaceae bacterium]